MQGVVGRLEAVEGGVKEVLGWISDEAGKFSKEVTVWGGEKGVADHMETCKVCFLVYIRPFLLPPSPPTLSHHFYFHF